MRSFSLQTLEGHLCTFTGIWVNAAARWIRVFEILDHDNHDVRNSGCSADTAPRKDEEVVDWVRDTRLWILLQQGEIYGGEADFELPAGKGTYRLKAMLFPTSFTEQQREILSKKKMTITVR